MIASTLQQIPQFGLQYRSDFQCVLFYDDVTAGAYAMDVFGELEHNLGWDLNFPTEVWSFDVLRLPLMQEEVARVAAGAGMVAISIHEADRLPGNIDQWLGRWLCSHWDHPIALVALLNRNHPKPAVLNGIRAGLRALPTNGSVGFFEQLAPMPKEAGTANADIGDLRTPAILQDLLRRSDPCALVGNNGSRGPN